MSRLPLLLSVPLAVGALAFLPATAASAAATSMSASATAAAEVGPAGKAGATASGSFTADGDQFCYTVTASNLADAVAMHIHKGAAGVNGPVSIPLDAQKIGAGKTCVTADAALVSAIVANPADYYFNVHTPAFPAGAVRGQLSVTAPSAVNAGSGGGATDDGGLPVLPTLLVLVGVGVAGTGWRLARR